MLLNNGEIQEILFEKRRAFNPEIVRYEMNGTTFEQVVLTTHSLVSYSPQKIIIVIILILNVFWQNDHYYHRQPSEVFCKEDNLIDFVKFTGEHLCQILFLIKLQTSACKFIKKETLGKVLSSAFCEIFKNTLRNISEHIQVTASVRHQNHYLYH